MLSIKPLQLAQIEYHWKQIQQNKRAFDDFTCLGYEEFLGVVLSPNTISLDIGDGRGLCSFVFDGANAYIQMVVYDFNYNDELCRTLCAIAFWMGASRITGTATDDRIPAQRLMERLGAKHEGTFRQAYYRDGDYHDVHIYGLLKGEFEWQQQ